MLGVRIAKRKIEPQKPANPCDTRLCSCIFSVNTRHNNDNPNFALRMGDEVRIIISIGSILQQAGAGAAHGILPVRHGPDILDVDAVMDHFADVVEKDCRDQGLAGSFLLSDSFSLQIPPIKYGCPVFHLTAISYRGIHFIWSPARRHCFFFRMVSGSRTGSRPLPIRAVSAPLGGRSAYAGCACISRRYAAGLPTRADARAALRSARQDPVYAGYAGSQGVGVYSRAHRPAHRQTAPGNSAGWNCCPR